MTDTEVLKGALCFRAPEYIRRDFNLPEAVRFGSNIRRRHFLKGRHFIVPS